MKARCGLEDCDCEYTIGKLLTALKEIRQISWRLRLRPPCTGAEINAWRTARRHADSAIAKAEED